MSILIVNIGSSSLKFALYLVERDTLRASTSGLFAGLEPHGEIRFSYTHKNTKHKQTLPSQNEPILYAIETLQSYIKEWLEIDLLAVAHRVVHGGSKYKQPILVDETVLRDLRELNTLAPLHQPYNIKGIEAFMKYFDGTPQVACFDTSFHQYESNLEVHYPLPESFFAQGIRKYGFHGLSYEYISSQLLNTTPKAKGKMLMAHLGNGSSLCACKNGTSVATTMGFSALDGLMMGTRSGSIDSGVLLYLLANGYNYEKLTDLLYKKSGLLGVSELSADMKTLQESSNEKAKFAIELYIHRLIKEMGGLIAVMRGVDVISFSGGIGEHGSDIRSQLALQLDYLGAVLDEEKNAQATGKEICAIHKSNSKIEIWVVPTNEEYICAKSAVRLLGE